MKKKNFITMLMGTMGGILFGIGMCMCLLPEWNAFTPGIVLGCVGAVVLLAMLIVRRKMEGKPPIQLNAKAIGAIALGAAGALLLGVGMCMIMIWNIFVPGIVVGILGIMLAISVIPVYRGIH